MTPPPSSAPKALRPKKLRPQDTVALIAPAFTYSKDAMEKGRAFLESHYDLKTTRLDSTAEQHAYFAGTDQRREDELFHWLTDSSVSAIMAIRGGYGCARIYPTLIERLKKHGKLEPKIVAGYSDLTILLNGLHQDLGWTTFHAPVMTGRPFRTPQAIEEDTFRRALFSDAPLGAITDDRTAVLVPGKARGKVVGGCLSLLTSSLGTCYEIQTDGAIVFLEDVDERPYRIDRMLTQLLHAGKFDKVKGVVFGQMEQCSPSPIDRDPSQTSALGAIELALVPYLQKKGIPAITNFPAGHGNPQATFPIGSAAELRAGGPKPELEFLESGVS